MSGVKKPVILRESLIDSNKTSSFVTHVSIGKMFEDDKENLVPKNGEKAVKSGNLEEKGKSCKNDKVLKPRSRSSSSLQLCIQLNEPESSFGLGFKVWDTHATEETESAKSVNVWDFSDSEAGPVSSWSTLPNRALLCRTLPMDVGKCTCIIQKEKAPQGFGGGSIYSLFTNEGHGRQNRKLAVAYHKRRSGRSVFIIAQNTKGVLSFSDESFVGVVTSNLMGSRYYIWDQGRSPRRKEVKNAKLLQAVVEFTPTIRTWTGSYRSISAWIPKKQHPLQVKNTNTQIQHRKGIPEWEGHQVQQLLSKVPYYNKTSKQYELDFRDKVKAGLKIQSSVKNFQLTMEGNDRQTIVQLCRIGKSTYILDYRHPLTGYQAFCISLASIDPKLCCTV